MQQIPKTMAGNKVIGKQKKEKVASSLITIDGDRKYDAKMVANEFGSFYLNIGSNLAKQINPGTTKIDDYLSRIPRTLNSLALHSTNPKEIEKIISSLPNKTSYGHDRISNKLLKSFNKAISYPLSLIFNQSIAQGVFPKRMQLAEVVPLHKGKDMDTVINYRSISLLITVLKVLEKIVYHHVYSFLEAKKIIYDSQYGLRTRHYCEQAIMEFTSRILQAEEKGEHSASIFWDLYGFRTRHNCEQAIMEFTSRILQAKEKGEHSASIFFHLSKAFDSQCTVAEIRLGI